jgi:hypothetical protein
VIVLDPHAGWRVLDLPPDAEAGLEIVLALSRAAPPVPHVLIVDLTKDPWRVLRVGASTDGPDAVWEADLEWAAKMAAGAGPGVRAVFVVRRDGDAAELVLAHPVAGRTADGRPS